MKQAITYIVGLMIFALSVCLFLVLTVKPVHALTLGASQGYVKYFCGSYASVIRTSAGYEVFSNAALTGSCPGSGCPGIMRYTGVSLTKLLSNSVVAPNSIINDLKNPDGTLHKDRMFSRPVVVRTANGYVAVSMVSKGYPPVDGNMVPALLTSPDGKNWTYKGKFKGEPEEFLRTKKVFGSGMALWVSDSKYSFITDGYGVGMALLTSDGNNTWTFHRNITGQLVDVKPPEWIGKNPIFHSMQKFNGKYYLSASDSWPVRGHMFAHSEDLVHWVHDAYFSVYSSEEKNQSLYRDGNKLMTLAPGIVRGSCFKKVVKQVFP